MTEGMRDSDTESIVATRPVLRRAALLSTTDRWHSALSTELALYLRFTGARVRGQMQYRTSFLLDVVSRFLVNGLELAAIFILFNQFSSLGEWRVGDVAFLYGLVT